MKDKINTIYIIKSNKTDKVYIGQTWRSIVRRLSEHTRLARNGFVNKLYASMRKYGEESFYIEILETTNTQEDADRLESFYIDKYHSIENGLNLKHGGAHGLFSDESRKKMSDSHMGEKNNRFGITGEQHPMFGKHHTDEVKKSIGDKLRGTNNKKFGKPVSEKQKLHLSEISKLAAKVNAKLTEDQVREIKLLIREGKLMLKEIAVIYNVGPDIISHIKRNKIWKWVTI